MTFDSAPDITDPKVLADLLGIADPDFSAPDHVATVPRELLHTVAQAVASKSGDAQLVAVVPAASNGDERAVHRIVRGIYEVWQDRVLETSEISVDIPQCFRLHGPFVAELGDNTMRVRARLRSVPGHRRRRRSQSGRPQQAKPSKPAETQPEARRPCSRRRAPRAARPKAVGRPAARAASATKAEVLRPQCSPPVRNAMECRRLLRQACRDGRIVDAAAQRRVEHDFLSGRRTEDLRRWNGIVL